MYLVLVDFSSASIHALGYAACIAQHTGHELTLFHQLTIDDSLEDDIDPFVKEKRMKEARVELERISNFANPKQNLKFHYEVYDDYSEVDLKKMILRKEIVLAFGGISKEDKIRKWLFGSRTADFIELGFCNFVAVPETACLGLPDEVLFPVSGEGQTEGALKFLTDHKLVGKSKVTQLWLKKAGKHKEVKPSPHPFVDLIELEVKDYHQALNEEIEERDPKLLCIVAGSKNSGGSFETGLAQKLSLSLPVPMLVILEKL